MIKLDGSERSQTEISYTYKKGEDIFYMKEIKHVHLIKVKSAPKCHTELWNTTKRFLKYTFIVNTNI